MGKIKIMILSDPPLARLIEHLFSGRAEFEILDSSREWAHQGEWSEALRPDLIVVNVKPLSSGIRQTVASIRRCSPSSKLILVCSVDALSREAGQYGADACLRGEMLTGQLVKTARTLSAPPPRRALVLA